jgi:hypothetical protein
MNIYAVDNRMSNHYCQSETPVPTRAVSLQTRVTLGMVGRFYLDWTFLMVFRCHLLHR